MNPPPRLEVIDLAPKPVVIIIVASSSRRFGILRGFDMSEVTGVTAALRHPDRFYIGGNWVTPSTGDVIEVDDSASEEIFLRVAEAREGDMDRAVSAARQAFDEGPWPRMTHLERAEHMRALAAKLRERSADISDVYPRESGVLYEFAKYGAEDAAQRLEFFAGLADTYPFEEVVSPTMDGGFGLLVREPTGVVGAIIPWNGPILLTAQKIGPALIAGCSIVLKLSPEAPGEGYIVAEAAEDAGLPAGVLNVITADREVSELLVTDPRVDKISFTGSSLAGKRIATLCGQRMARCTLELGGKSAAVILDDYDIETAATSLAGAMCLLAGQNCGALSRIVIHKDRHDDFVSALADSFSQVVVGDPFDPATQMGPLAMERQRDRVEGYIQKGIDSGAKLVTGGGRPKHLPKGWFVEPTVFAHVDNSAAIAQEEIFGPVLSVIPADDEDDAIRIANDTAYGLNGAVFTRDTNRARDITRRMRSGTVGHNGMRFDNTVSFGGFKQSGYGREGGLEGLREFVETKMVILDGPPTGYAT
jgi:acyl-CoA reductase-like NAD-dependent aldehyde dehydrogenase